MTAAWHAFFTVSNDDWQQLDGALNDFFETVVVKPADDAAPFGDQLVSLIFAAQPDADNLRAQLAIICETNGAAAPSITVEALPDIDWLQKAYDSLPPIEAGRFFVHGAHVKNIPGDKLAIIIEAAAAFGTGEHPTTKGCLLMLDRYLQAHTPRRILDMGCGSGILAIAAAKAVPTTDVILGIDIDKPSIFFAQSHADANHVADRVTFLHGDGFHAPEVNASTPYDLIFGNILAQPLIEMADKFCACASGDLIVSGFTETQKAYVEKAYHALGCTTHHVEQIEEWITLWLRKN